MTATNSPSEKYLVIDPEGFIKFGETRLTEVDDGQALLKNIIVDPGVGPQLRTNYQGHTATVEPFDAPLVIQAVDKIPEQLGLTAPYNYKFNVHPSVLTLDEWDRFHGYTDQGISFVFSRKAQNQFFDLCDEFSDDTFTIDSKEYTPALWLGENSDASKATFWEGKFLENHTPWDLQSHHPSLENILPQIKLNKQRVLILGCGSGHDAAYLAQQGHIVTAVDISETAIKEAQQKFSAIDNLQFVVGDAFSLPETYNNQYDLVYEYTMYCAIEPPQRNNLVKAWNRYLHSEGQLLGIFFVFDRHGGPPFGGSEWEIQSRLEKYYSFLYWTRWRHSPPGRQGVELVVYAQKKQVLQ